MTVGGDEGGHSHSTACFVKKKKKKGNGAPARVRRVLGIGRSADMAPAALRSKTTPWRGWQIFASPPPSRKREGVAMRCPRSPCRKERCGNQISIPTGTRDEMIDVRVAACRRRRNQTPCVTSEAQFAWIGVEDDLDATHCD